MDKIKVSEIFYSAQGEGRFIGVPSVFFRTFGCNFKCACPVCSFAHLDVTSSAQALACLQDKKLQSQMILVLRFTCTNPLWTCR